MYYFRQRTPADLRILLGDKIVGRSMRTKDPVEAKLRHLVIAQEQAILWERHRKQPEPLPNQQIVALMGKFYRSDIASMEQELGEATIGVALQKSNDPVSARPEGLEK